MDGFSKIAPFLSHPLVLTGFALFLLFGLLRAVLSSDKISPLGERESAWIFERLALGGLWVAVLVVILGFGLAFVQNSAESGPAPVPDAYRVRVSVVAPDGAPVRDAEVESSVGGEVRRGAGIWELIVPRSSVPASGVVEVRAERGGERGTADVVLADDPQPAVTVELAPRPEVAIRGTVVDTEGRPVAGAQVSVEGRQGGVETDEDGWFELAAVAEEGEWRRLRVRAEGFRVLEELVMSGGRAKSLELESREKDTR